MKRTYTNFQNETVEITDLEFKVIYFLKSTHMMEDCFTDDPQSISDKTGIPMNALRGVISSLIKKDIAYMDHVAHDHVEWLLLWEEKEDGDVYLIDEVREMIYGDKNPKSYNYSLEELQNFYFTNHKDILQIAVESTEIKIFMNDNTIAIHNSKEDVYDMLYFFDQHGQKFTAIQQDAVQPHHFHCSKSGQLGVFYIDHSPQNRKDNE